MDRNEHHRKLERMYASAPFNAHFEPSLRIDDGVAEVVLPLREELHHAAGAVHGAVLFKAMDDAAFFAANSLVTDAFVVTVSFAVTFLRPVASGELRCRGTVVHRSSRLLVAEAVVEDAGGQVVGRGSGTFMPSRIPLTEEIGYR